MLNLSRYFNSPHYLLLVPKYFFCLDKLILGPGYDFKDLILIDHESKSVCANLGQYRIQIGANGLYGTFGGLLSQKYPLICGGVFEDTHGTQWTMAECYIIGQDSCDIALTLREKKSHAASIVLGQDEDSLVVTGGVIRFLPELSRIWQTVMFLETTEIIRIGQDPLTGPPVPHGQIAYHCMVKIDPERGLFIGGENEILSFYEGDSTIEYQTKMITIKNDQEMFWSNGPDLQVARSNHACGTMKNPTDQTLMVVVTGGRDVFDESLDVTEILIIDQQNLTNFDQFDGLSWFSGPDLVYGLTDLTAVSDILGGHSLLLLGGHNKGYSDHMYELTCAHDMVPGKTTCQWKDRGEVEVKTTNAIAMTVPGKEAQILCLKT